MDYEVIFYADKSEVATLSKKNSENKNTLRGLEKELVDEGIMSGDELREIHMQANLMCELAAARRERNISQQQLEELSGVKRPVISRIENGTSIPRIDTVMRVLAPLGKTLAIVPLEDSVSGNKYAHRR